MRCFQMIRDEDQTGISGTGVVAQGVEFDDGTVVIRWQTHGDSHHSTVVWASLEDARAIHGHGGRTWFQFTQGLPWPPADEHNDPAELAEEGRRLASRREDLIAQGVDPNDLEVPLHPVEATDDENLRTWREETNG